MSFFDWLRRRVPTVEQPVELVVSAPPQDYVPVVADEDLEMEKCEVEEGVKQQHGAENRKYDLEPMLVVIDYRDAGGRASRRRITTRWISVRGGVSYLGAICHERRSHRTFRLDRVEGVIDDDGVVEEPISFFKSVLEGDPGYVLLPDRPGVQGKTKAPTGASPYTLLRREIMPAITILVAAARSDEVLHPDEVDRIMLYTEREAGRLEDEGLVAQCPDLAGFERLGRLILRLRPTIEDVDAALDDIAQWPPNRIRRLERALHGVVAADGEITGEEERFVREFSDTLIGGT